MHYPGKVIPLLLCILSTTLISLPGYSADLALVYQQASEQDPIFRAAKSTLLSNSEAVPLNRSRLLPSLTLTVVKSETTQNILDGSPFVSANQSQSYTLTLKQALFHYDYFARMGQAKRIVSQAGIEYAAARQALIIRTAQQYFDTLAALDTLNFAHAETTALARQLEQTQQRFEVGLIAITDVHESQAAYDLVTAQAIEAENDLASQYEALRELTNQYQKSLSTLSDDLPLLGPEPADIDHWSQQALQFNLELKSTQLQTHIARYDIRIAQAGHLPQLDFNASHRYNDRQNATLNSGITEEQTLSLQLTLPLYQGGAVNSRVRSAKSRYQQAIEAESQQQRRIVRLARDTYLGVLAAIKRVTALQQAVISAKSALSATEAGLEVGTRTTVDVLQSQRNLFRAQRNHARARYDYILNTLQLKQLSGNLTLDDLLQVNRWLSRST